ncbi:MAG TPA: dipicolinate synthase subunit DpsA [Pseudobacteroides sp.]|nr:dipicolinate synthase subunit DpsA [Pseudobacteroides sp.]
MGNIKFTVIGGDIRSIKLANFIAQDGYKVDIYGFNNASFDTGLPESPDMNTAVSEADIVIGPLPCSNDNETINAPFHQGKIYINEIFQTMKKNQIFIAGRVSKKIQQLAQLYDVNTVDILEREDMAVLNAIPTAEGAIQIAMEEMAITLHDSKCLILGFGRIGKILAKMLSALGAEVYVEARKFSDIAWIKSYGYKPVLLDNIDSIIPQADAIFNTIPSIILDESKLKLLNKDCLIIDLASKPGGVDFDKAKELGVKAIWALSLPGKVAPITAAKFIKETVFNIIGELGV